MFPTSIRSILKKKVEIKYNTQTIPKIYLFLLNPSYDFFIDIIIKYVVNDENIIKNNKEKILLEMFMNS